MKRIEQDEIFNNLSTFLKSRGIELTAGAYANGIRQSCSLLTGAINLGQESIERAKTEVEKTCDQMRQVIHEKTAPKASATPPPPSPPPQSGPAPTPRRPKSESHKSSTKRKSASKKSRSR